MDDKEIKSIELVDSKQKDKRWFSPRNVSQLPWWFFVIILLIFWVGSLVYRSYASIDRLLVRLNEERITKIEDFTENDNLVLGVEAASDSIEIALMHLEPDDFETFETLTLAVNSLLDGEIDSVIINDSTSKKFIREHEGQLALIGRSLTLNNTHSYWDSFNFIYVGLTITLRVSFISYLIALVFGLIAGLGRISNSKVFNNLSTLYVELIRGIPILVLIFFIALVTVPAIVESVNGLGTWLANGAKEQLDSFLPSQLHFLVNFAESAGIRLSSFGIRDIPSEWRAIIALSVTYGAFLAEIFRAGIQSIGRGQMEASRSLGMSISQAMRYVILPQAIRNVLPALGNDFVAMVKDSSLVSVLAVQDITQLSRKYTGTSFRYKEAFTVLTILYLTMTLTLSLLVRSLERRLHQND